MDTKELQDFKSRLNDKINGCVYDLTKSMIDHCQCGLISVEECMNQLDGVNFFEKAIKKAVTN